MRGAATDAAEHAGNLNYISFDVGVVHLASRLLPRRGWRHGDPSVAGLGRRRRTKMRSSSCTRTWRTRKSSGGRRTSLSLSNNLLVRSGAYRPSGWRFAITRMRSGSTGTMYIYASSGRCKPSGETVEERKARKAEMKQFSQAEPGNASASGYSRMKHATLASVQRCHRCPMRKCWEACQKDDVATLSHTRTRACITALCCV
jgi:hypothetical protein